MVEVSHQGQGVLQTSPWVSWPFQEQFLLLAAKYSDIRVLGPLGKDVSMVVLDSLEQTEKVEYVGVGETIVWYLSTALVYFTLSLSDYLAIAGPDATFANQPSSPASRLLRTSCLKSARKLSISIAVSSMFEDLRRSLFLKRFDQLGYPAVGPMNDFLDDDDCPRTLWVAKALSVQDRSLVRRWRILSVPKANYIIVAATRILKTSPYGFLYLQPNYAWFSPYKAL
ncbi:hypothetical protein C8J56DRAFT_886788 [Mycena floridula]|nr:hypothetical protein C8J56DRAFT_886788 [Mycena floridula]